MAGPLNILCIDDDRSILAIIELALELDPAISVRTAEDAVTALTILTRGEWVPGCILLDARMPHEDGRLLFGEIRTIPNYAAVPVIFLTAAVTPPEIAEFLALGALGVIAKPFDPITLAGDVREMLAA